MTVNSVDITDGPYIGNGVADTFDYSFSLQVGDELKVYETDFYGNQRLLVLNVDYSRNISGGGQGSITRADGPLPTGWQIYIRSDFKATQLTSFSSQGAFFPELHEKAVDKLTYLIQQTNDIASRGLRFPESYAAGVNGALLPLPSPGDFIQWNIEGNGFENVKPSEIDPAIVDISKYAYTVNSIAELTALGNPANARVVYCKSYHAGTIGVGGGFFIQKLGAPVADLGKIIASVSPGYYWERQHPRKTPYEFGFIDGGADVSVAVNACTVAYGACYLDPGKTYNLQYQIKPLLFHCIGGGAVLNCTSPTGNNRFGSLNAAVYPLGGVGSPLEGVDIRNIHINCNKLIGVTGSTGIKGYLFQRLKNFKQAGCIVTNCASYGFWDYDTATTGTTYCSGIRDNCGAIDCAVSFEQVNVRGVTLNNCVAYTSAGLTGMTVEAQFHFYGGADMQLTYNNCRGIADGPCPVICLVLLEAKNVNINDCTFINNYNLGSGNITAAVYAEGTGGNYDNINFKNCILTSTYSAAVYVQPGLAGAATHKWTFTGCRITGIQIGVQFNGTGGRYIFDNCETSASAPNPIQPFAYYNNASNPVVQIRNGWATASGPAVGAAASNLDASSFLGTIQSPAGTVLPSVRQRLVGIGTVISDGAYAYSNIPFPSAVLGWTSLSANTTKLGVEIVIDYGLSGAPDLPTAAGAAYPVSVAMVDNQTVRIIFSNTAAATKKFRYVLTEYS